MQTKILSAKQSYRIWLRPDPHNNNVILCVKRNIIIYIIYSCYWVSCHWYCIILLTIMHIFWTFVSKLRFWFLVVWQLTTSLLRIIKCPIMSDQNTGWSVTMSDQVFRIILNSELRSFGIWLQKLTWRL
jgi:hypothetical protein